MKAKTVSIPDINCGHCEKRISEALNEMPGVSSAKPDSATKTLIVDFEDSLAWADIVAELERIGYPAAS